MHQKIVGSILGQGAYGRQPIDVSFSPFPPSSLKSISISSRENLKKKKKTRLSDSVSRKLT